METIMTNPSKTALVPIVLRDCLISSWRWHLTAAAGSLGTVAVLGRSSCLLAKMARMAMENPLFIEECPIDTSSSRGMPVCQQMEAALELHSNLQARPAPVTKMNLKLGI